LVGHKLGATDGRGGRKKEIDTYLTTVLDPGSRTVQSRTPLRSLIRTETLTWWIASSRGGRGKREGEREKRGGRRRTDGTIIVFVLELYSSFD